MKKALLPFCEGESASAWLQGHLTAHGPDRAALYCLHIVNSLIQDGKELFQRIPQEALPGFREGGRRNAEASVLLRAGFAASGEYPAGEPGGGGEKEGQERLIRAYAFRDGCWYGDAPKYLGRHYKKLAEGGEAEVFFSGAHVIKFISNIYFDSYAEALDRIALHNRLSPAAPLTVLGFGVNGRGDHGVVVRQPFIQGRHLSEDDIRRELENIGFRREESFKFSLEYTNGDYYVGDMHDENAVLSPNGDVALIDTDSRLNVPKLKCGGTYRIPELSYSEDAVEAIGRVMRVLAPVAVPRIEYEDRYHTEENHLNEQLALNGRYDGALTAPDGRRFLLQVDPKDKGQLLRIWCEGAAVMLDRERGFSEDEKMDLAAGRCITRGDRTCAFNIDLGRVTVCRNMPIKISKRHVDKIKPVVDSEPYRLKIR